MSHQGEDGWYPECKICNCGNLSDVVCLDCHKEALKALKEEREEYDKLIKDLVHKKDKDCKRYLKEQREDILKDAIATINTEIGCIKDGNALSPTEQDMAIKVAENIKTRLKNN